MDPVTAVGVAAAALQFLDASIKVYNTFQEIRGSSIFATKHNQQLEDNIRSAQSLRSGLKSACTPQGANDPISKLSDQCISKADELLKLLEHVRGSGKSISRAQAFLRALHKRKAIEELHCSLKENQGIFNHMITQKLLPSIDLLKVEQSKEFAKINSIGQELIKAQIEQRRIQESHHVTLTDRLDSIQCDMQLRMNTADQIKKRGKLLESLWFPDIDQRRNEIKEPAPRTLEWFFGLEPDTDSENDSDPEHDTDSEDDSDPEYDTDLESGYYQLPWPDFRQWLREDTSTYWISGKAGSGKSTLMAYIADDKRTREDLEVWSSGHTLRVLSFFFWRAGSQLQNSVLGLLRSLLYQICLLEPDISDIILSKLSSPGEMIPTWTERSLLGFIMEAIRSSKGIRFCIFVDGLDEYTGPYDDLVDHIERLGNFGNLKACISSRPDVELAKRFQGLKYIRLQDLNWNDIKAFVEGALRKTQLSENFRLELIRDVTWRAEGVFLWASLVTQSLVKGSKVGDSESTIRERLDTLPSDMDKLFERMLSEVDPVHRKSLAFYLQLMNLDRKCPPEQFYRSMITVLPIIVTAQLEKDINSYEQFANECELTEMRIATRTAGLLEVSQNRWHETYERDWTEATFRFANTHPNFLLMPETPNRRICSKDEPYPAMLNYETRKIKWMHRSAFEFLSNLDNNPLLEYNWSPETLFRRIGEAHIIYAMAAPSCTGNEPPWLIEDWLTSAIIFLNTHYDDYPMIASSLLDTLCTACTQIDGVHELQRMGIHKLAATDNITTAGDYWFWTECAGFHRLHPYIMSRLDFIFKGPSCEDLVVHVLFVCFVHFSSPTCCTQFLNSLADVLTLSVMKRFEMGGFPEAAKHNNIIIEEDSRTQRFGPFLINSATWKEPINGCMLSIMKRLIEVLDCDLLLFIRHITSNHQIPTPLLTLMEFMNLYISPSISLNKIRIQISARAWTILCSAFKNGISAMTQSSGVDRGGTIGRHVSTIEVDRAVQILCLPYHKSTHTASRRREFGHSFKAISRATKLQASNFICLRPSAATSDRVLSLLGYLMNPGTCEFGILPDTQKRLEVVDMLLREIKSDEQGLNGGQQLLAAACVKAGLLNINSDQFLYINNSDQSSHNGDG